jgi:hypothetical protein
MPYDPESDRFLAFFAPQVLAQYRDQPDRYKLTTDNFEGRVTLTGKYYSQLNDAEQKNEDLEIMFGYRTLKNGELCIAIFKHDLTQKSEGHVDRWLPYLVKDGDWLDYDSDERFSLWFRRYAEGDWGVDNGPAFHFIEEIKFINGLTLEVLGCKLYDVGDEPPLTFPVGENTWKYEDAHVSLYGLLIDGLSMGCIRVLASRLNRTLDKGATRAPNALMTALPQLRADDKFVKPLEKVSEQRGLASHGVRPPARPMRAFEAFFGDLNACLAALRLLKSALEKELNMDAKRSRKRQEALKYLPRIVRTPESSYSINGALAMKGKTVDSVEVGARHEIAGVHQSEAIIIHFTDGSIMSVDAGSNAGNLRCEEHPPEKFHVNFRVHWVPAPKP